MDHSETHSALNRRRFWRWGRRIYVVLVAAVLCWALISAWPSVRMWPLQRLLPAACGMSAGWILMVLLLGRGWATSLKAWSNLELSMRHWLPMQLTAWAGRYLPGKLGLLAGKLQVCEQGLPWGRVTASVLAEQVAFIVSGLSLSMLALTYWGSALPADTQLFLTSVEPLWPLLVAGPLLVGSWAGALTTRRSAPEASPYWAAKLLSWSLLAHASAGTGFYLLLQALLPSPPSWPASIGLLAAAHTAGVLAIFAPAGIGVREAVIASALAPHLGWPQALAISALQRGLVVFIDAGLALTAFWLQRGRSTSR